MDARTVGPKLVRVVFKSGPILYGLVRWSEFLRNLVWSGHSCAPGIQDLDLGKFIDGAFVRKCLVQT